VVQDGVTAKFGSITKESRCRVTVPVLLRVTVWGTDILPTLVMGKVSEFCEAE
jgi:hypothetical protein